jgi:superfamily II DNA/RNA helicase
MRFEDLRLCKPRRRAGHRSAGQRHAVPQSRNTKNKGTNTVSARVPRSFTELGLSRPLLTAVERVGFRKPTDIQRELIPPALAGRDCLGQARTGTGKTAVSALPLLQNVRPGCGLQALVLVPTRELAAQVGEHAHLLSPDKPPRTLLVYGGIGRADCRPKSLVIHRGQHRPRAGSPGDCIFAYSAFCDRVRIPPNT